MIEYKGFYIKESAIHTGKYRLLDSSLTSVGFEKPTYYESVDKAKERIDQQKATNVE